ncbi:hypothetical protein PENTCL1PPCAC_25748, partial [Pristionchus entomophagus]
KNREVVIPFWFDVSSPDKSNAKFQWFISPPLIGFTPEQFGFFHIRLSILLSILAAIFIAVSPYFGSKLHHPDAIISYLLPFLVLVPLVPLPFLFFAGVGMTNKNASLIYPHIVVLGMEFFVSIYFLFSAFSRISYYVNTVEGWVDLILQLVHFAYSVQVIRVMNRVIYDIKKGRSGAEV